MVLVNKNLLTLLLLVGSSSLSHAGALRSKKGLSTSGKGGSPGKGVSSAGKGAKKPPPPPPPSPELGGAPETASACGVQPPSLTGGCDAACEFNKVAQAGARAVLGRIPVVGSFVSNLVGLFWPSGPNLAQVVLQETIQYIDAMIVEVEDTIFTKELYVKYQDLATNVQTLSTWIQDGTPGRYGFLDQHILNGVCVDLNNKIVIEGLDTLKGQINGGNSTSQLGANPAALLAAIGNIGQICLAMRYVQIYEYNTTFEGPPQNNATVNASKAMLDNWVQDYTTWAQNATALALAWRTNQINAIDQKCHADDDGTTVCGSVNGDLVLGLTDSVCYAMGGPPADMQFVVGDTSGQCVCSDTDVATDVFPDFIPYYQQIVLQGFTDNLLSPSRALVPLWKYQTTENIEAGIKPTTVIRAATSLIDSYLKIELQVGGEHRFMFPETMEGLYTVYNGDTSSGQRTDRITEIVLQSTGGYVFKAVVSQVVGGQDTTLQLGKSTYLTDDDQTHSFEQVPLTLADNERIVAVGAFECNNSTTVCPGQGFAFKTAYVNASGAYAGEGRILNPFGYPEDGPWIVAPQLAQARNATFLPYVIGFNGWSTVDSKDGMYKIAAKVPVWLYESLE